MPKTGSLRNINKRIKKYMKDEMSDRPRISQIRNMNKGTREDIKDEGSDMTDMKDEGTIHRRLIEEDQTRNINEWLGGNIIKVSENKRPITSQIRTGTKDQEEN